MKSVEIFNIITAILFFVCYFYQFVYLAVSLFRYGDKKKAKPTDESCPAEKSRIAILIAARNEARVIGGLLDSISRQTYDPELIDVYVGADNCTDDTAGIARAHGAVVFERNDTVHVGKGYVLDFLLKKVDSEIGKKYDAYIVPDADNILDPDFVREITRVYNSGYEIVTCYRNSKNYGDNFISAGYALWFLRESRYLNDPRMRLGSSCAVSGTGFLFSDKAIRELGGWSFYLLTEDIEFTIQNAVDGRKIGYAEKAVIYDEQPTDFAQSWRQRLRWTIGYIQVYRKYFGKLVGGIFHGSFSCYDMAMNIMPAAVLSALSTIVNLTAFLIGISQGKDVSSLIISALWTVAGLYLTLLFHGGLTTITEWRKIRCSSAKKVLYALTFPLYMMTYIPICIAAVFAKPEWKPIVHEKSVTLDEIMELDGDKNVDRAKNSDRRRRKKQTMKRSLD